jgi:hypothetical protein
VHSKYTQWIATYLARVGSPRGQCVVAANEMREAFPELVEVRGWFHCAEHCWLLAPDGTIVDPTVSQFGMWDTVPEAYRAWKPGDEVRVGRCMECGDDIYRVVQTLDDGVRESFCDVKCRSDFVTATDGVM